MTDLTAIKTPFGLLDRETQEALKAHGGQYEYYDVWDAWETSEAPVWVDRTTYRVKPAPPKPREWFVTGGHLHETRVEANAWVCRYPEDGPVIHVREVLPE